jgi:hypothetical protein
MASDTIVPDDKDWTWVLERPCPECGFDASTTRADEVASLVRANAATWPALLTHPSAAVRPDPGTWSALEYACHVRDVHRLYERRLNWMLEQDDPLFENWDQDVTAVEDAYGAQDPAAVAAELAEAAEVIAAHFESLPPEAWSRPGRRSDGAAFTVDTFARYFVHDPIHHSWDAEAGYRALAAAAPADPAG